MEKILYNLALIDTTKFCIENNIDCSGTHLTKTARKFQYNLIKADTKKPVVSVTFHKAQTPTHIVY